MYLEKVVCIFHCPPISRFDWMSWSHPRILFSNKIEQNCSSLRKCDLLAFLNEKRTLCICVPSPEKHITKRNYSSSRGTFLSWECEGQSSKIGIKLSLSLSLHLMTSWMIRVMMLYMLILKWESFSSELLRIAEFESS